MGREGLRRGERRPPPLHGATRTAIEVLHSAADEPREHLIVVAVEEAAVAVLRCAA